MDDVLTPADVAKRLKKSEPWVTAEARSGRLPGRKVGRTWRFTDADVTAYLDRVAVVSATKSVPVRRRGRAA